MNNNDDGTPEEIVRANTRIEAVEQEKTQLKLKENNSTQGWGFFTWLMVFAIALGIVVSSKSSIKSEYHHGFLYAVIFLQAALASLIIRAFAALFTCTSAGAFLVELLAIVILGVILFVVALVYLLVSGNFSLWT